MPHEHSSVLSRTSNESFYVDLEKDWPRTELQTKRKNPKLSPNTTGASQFHSGFHVADTSEIHTDWEARKYENQTSSKKQSNYLLWIHLVYPTGSIVYSYFNVLITPILRSFMLYRIHWKERSEISNLWDWNSVLQKAAIILAKRLK